MSLAASLVSRGAVAVYGVTSSLYLFTRVQHHKAAAQDFSSRFLAEEGKVTGLTQELNQTKEQLRVALDVVPPWPAPEPEPQPPKKTSCECDSSVSMFMGTLAGGGIALLAALAK
jgi:hypothetical protein